MDALHLAVHARSRRVGPGRTVELHGFDLRALDVPPESLAEPLALSFDEAAGRITAAASGYLEPDGSFGLRGGSAPDAWRLAGVLYDAGDRLQYAELWLDRHPDAARQVVLLFSRPEQPLMFQFIRPALFVAPDELLRYCQAAT